MVVLIAKMWRPATVFWRFSSADAIIYQGQAKYKLGNGSIDNILDGLFWIKKLTNLFLVAGTYGHISLIRLIVQYNLSLFI